ncbi:MAG: hypothetical protein ABI643_03960 [Candidatus Doudnabacteria bacterium]
MSSLETRTERTVAAVVLQRWYEISLKPSVVHEAFFDNRAERILGLVSFLRGEEFATELFDVVEKIVADLMLYMPTDKQIEGSRNSSIERFDKLKPMKFNPVPMASAT